MFHIQPHPSHTLDGFTFFKDFATIKREEIYRAEVYDSEGTLAVPRGTLRDKGARPLVNTSFDTVYNHLSLLYSP